MTFSYVTNTHVVLNDVWVILVSPWISHVVLGKKNFIIKLIFTLKCIGLDNAHGHNNLCILIIDVWYLENYIINAIYNWTQF